MNNSRVQVATLFNPTERSTNTHGESLGRRALLCGFEGRRSRDVQVDGAARSSSLEHQVGVELCLRVVQPRGRTPHQAILTPEKRGGGRQQQTLMAFLGHESRKCEHLLEPH